MVVIIKFGETKMRLEDGRIVLETVDDGLVVADAAQLGTKDSHVYAEIYRKVNPDLLPMLTGRWATTEALEGLEKIAEEGITVGEHLDPTTAKGYLALLDASS